MDKRVVLTYTTGRHKGLQQILGTVEQLKTGMGLAELPAFVPEVQFLDHVGAVNLVAVRQSYVLYREMITPALTAAGSFHPEQR